MRRALILVLLSGTGCGGVFDPDLSDLSDDDGTATDDTLSTEGDGADGHSSGDGGNSGTETTSGDEVDSSDDESSDDGGTGTNTGTSSDDTETGSGELGPGDECHPLSHEMDDVPDCPEPLTCYWQGWDIIEEHWNWACEESEGQGGWLEPCEFNTNSCAQGFRCLPNVFVEGDCPDIYCCTPYCDPANDTCPEGYYCMASDDPSYFPPSFQDTDIPLVGWCTKT